MKPEDLRNLPEYVREEMLLKTRGKPTEWMYQTAEPGKYTAFLKDGKPGYKSECPFYDGYYLDGSHGGTSCNACGGMILFGLHYYLVCKKNHENCPFYKEEISREAKYKKEGK